VAKNQATAAMALLEMEEAVQKQQKALEEKEEQVRATPPARPSLIAQI
jgi:hypothetical protein